MKKRDETLDNIPSKIHELEKQGFTPIGAYLDDGGSKPGGDIKNSVPAVAPSPTSSRIGRTFSKIEKLSHPVKGKHGNYLRPIRP